VRPLSRRCRMSAGQGAVAGARVLLDCPYAEKEVAKSHGARWDRVQKKWYVEAGTYLAPFAAWLPAGGGSARPVSALAVGCWVDPRLTIAPSSGERLHTVRQQADATSMSHESAGQARPVPSNRRAQGGAAPAAAGATASGAAETLPGTEASTEGDAAGEGPVVGTQNVPPIYKQQHTDAGAEGDTVGAGLGGAQEHSAPSGATGSAPSTGAVDVKVPASSGALSRQQELGTPARFRSPGSALAFKPFASRPGAATAQVGMPSARWRHGDRVLSTFGFVLRERERERGRRGIVIGTRGIVIGPHDPNFDIAWGPTYSAECDTVCVDFRPVNGTKPLLYNVNALRDIEPAEGADTRKQNRTKSKNAARARKRAALVQARATHTASPEAVPASAATAEAGPVQAEASAMASEASDGTGGNGGVDIAALLAQFEARSVAREAALKADIFEVINRSNISGSRGAARVSAGVTFAGGGGGGGGGGGATIEVQPAASTSVGSVKKRKLKSASAGGAVVEVHPAASISVGSVKKRKLRSEKRQVCDELNKLRRDQRQCSARQRRQRRALKVQLKGLKHSHGNDNHGKGTARSKRLRRGAVPAETCAPPVPADGTSGLEKLPCTFYINDEDRERVQKSVTLPPGVLQKVQTCQRQPCAFEHSLAASASNRDRLIQKRRRKVTMHLKPQKPVAADAERQGFLKEFDWLKGFGWIYPIKVDRGGKGRRQRLWFHVKDWKGSQPFPSQAKHILPMRVRYVRAFQQSSMRWRAEKVCFGGPLKTGKRAKGGAAAISALQRQQFGHRAPKAQQQAKSGNRSNTSGAGSPEKRPQAKGGNSSNTSGAGSPEKRPLDEEQHRSNVLNTVGLRRATSCGVVSERPQQARGHESTQGGTRLLVTARGLDQDKQRKEQRAQRFLPPGQQQR